jgi:hypothetical protein
MTAALQLVCDYGFEVAGLRLIRWRALVGNWASRRVAAKAGLVFYGAVRGLLVQRGELHDGWIATLVRDDPRVPQPWLRSLGCARSRCKALVSDCGPSAAPMSTASSKPAPTRARHIGSFRCRGRTGVTTHWPTSSPWAGWPRVVPAWRGA